MKSFYDWLSRKTSAELMVWSFVVASFVGGTALYISEYNREVIDVVPVIEQVNQTNSTTQETTTVPVVATTTVTKKGESYVDSVFSAVSALCVTGLTSTDFSQYTLIGQIILMILIQIGGLGVIVFTSFFALLIVRGLSSHDGFKEAIAGLVDVGRDEVRPMLGHILRYTIAIEGFFFLVMGSRLQWGPLHSIMVEQSTNPRRWSWFHAVSAFNNAGFTLFNDNLVKFVTDPVISLSIAFLIILGGIGYPVLIVIHTRLRKKTTYRDDAKQQSLEQEVKDVVASPVQTKVAIYGTLLLLAVGTLFPYITDYNNPIFANLNGRQTFVANFFQSVSTRTAGFNTVDIGALSPAVLLVYIVLMYIGANPAGTGGGIKIPTVAVLLGYVRDRFAEPGQAVKLFGHKISKFAVSHAVRLFFVSIGAITLVTLLICVFENHYMMGVAQTPFNFLKIYFETVSAFATVGLSMGFPGGVTSFSGILSDPSKIALIAIMLLGRLGPLTVLAAIPLKKKFMDMTSPDHDDVEKIQIG